MPLYQTIQTPQDATIGIWRIEESIGDLQKNLPPNLWQQNPVRNITSLRRQKEWLATRALVRQLVPNKESSEIVYDSYGKPTFFQNPRHLSITHSKQFAAVILHPQMSLGIDIEPIQSRFLRLQHKFLSEKEKTQICNEDLLQLTLFWSAKETLYKLYGKKQLDFKKHLFIHKQHTTENNSIKTEGYLETSISKNDFHLDAKVYYQKIEDNILTYTLSNN